MNGSEPKLLRDMVMSEARRKIRRPKGEITWVVHESKGSSTCAPDVSVDPQFACALLLEVDVICKWGHLTASKRQNVIATWKV